MRLYPPAHTVARRALHDVTIGGHTLRKGWPVIVSISSIHRRHGTWSEPDRFDPSRFEPEREKAIPRHAYIPFGAGARICIGNQFALLEGQLALAAIAGRARLDLLSGWQRIDPQPLVTLRPGSAIRMRVTRRG
jgi:cytochrome P450